MIKLRLLNLDTKGNLVSFEECGNYRSYVDIGNYLRRRGKLGKYYAIPNNITNLAGIREINVTKDKYGKEVEMEGSIY